MPPGSRSPVAVDFVDNPALFLAVAEEYLAAAPVETNVVATVANRAMQRPPGDLPYFWFAVVRRDAEVVGVAMRTAPFEPWPLYVGPMPEERARLVARALHERGEHPGGANGALPAARILAEESARLWGGRVEQAMATRLWELGTLTPPPGVDGRARPATYDDVELCQAWFNDFGRAAREQAGNVEGAQGHEHFDADDILARIDDERILLWETADGTVAHLTGFNHPALGVARIGPVYTPTEHRGHGYASATVAEASRRLQETGARICLFTDVGNPVANRIYAALGFVPVADAANHTVL